MKTTGDDILTIDSFAFAQVNLGRWAEVLETVVERFDPGALAY